MLSPSIGFSQRNDTLLKDLRLVNIDKGKTIILQGDIVSLSESVIRSAKTFYYLKKGSFIRADSIGIETDDKNKIIALTFLYGYDSASVKEPVFIHELKKYQKFFQANGKQYEFKSDLFSIRVNRWEDKTTIFELIETNRNGKLTVYSRIFDKELYYIRYKSKCDLNKADNSIELLRCMGFL